jgi:hypothetical protein
MFVGGLVAFIVLAVIVLNNPAGTPGAQGDATPSTEKVFAAISLDAVRSLTVRENASNLSVELVQGEDGTWTVTNNPNPAQQQALDNAVASIINIQSSDRFEAQDLAPYGLDNPTHTLTITTQQNEYTLRIGSRNPSGTRYYALVNDDAQTVYMLSNVSAVTTVTGYITTPPIVQITPTPAPALEVVGPLFPTYNAADIQTLTLARAQDSTRLILLRQDDGTWALDPFSTGYAADPLDQVLADTMVQAMGGLSSVDILRDVPDVATLGLAEPAYTITATRADGFEHVLKIGSPDPSGTRYYAQIFDLPNVAVVSRADVDSLLQFIGLPPFIKAVEAEATPEATPEATAAP